MRESPQLILTVSQRNALLEGSIVLRQKFVQKLARKPMPGCVRGSAQGLSERTAFTGHGGGGGGRVGGGASQMETVWLPRGKEGRLLPLSEAQHPANLRLFHCPHWHLHTELSFRRTSVSPRLSRAMPWDKVVCSLGDWSRAQALKQITRASISALSTTNKF